MVDEKATIVKFTDNAQRIKFNQAKAKADKTGQDVWQDAVLLMIGKGETAREIQIRLDAEIFELKTKIEELQNKIKVMEEIDLTGANYMGCPTCARFDERPAESPLCKWYLLAELEVSDV